MPPSPSKHAFVGHLRSQGKNNRKLIHHVASYLIHRTDEQFILIRGTQCAIKYVLQLEDTIALNHSISESNELLS